MHSYVSNHLVWFHILVIVNNATTNMRDENADIYVR